jgi:hypothetical protein
MDRATLRLRLVVVFSHTNLPACIVGETVDALLDELPFLGRRGQTCPPPPKGNSEYWPLLLDSIQIQLDHQRSETDKFKAIAEDLEHRNDAEQERIADLFASICLDDLLAMAGDPKAFLDAINPPPVDGCPF